MSKAKISPVNLLDAIKYMADGYYITIVGCNRDFYYGSAEDGIERIWDDGDNKECLSLAEFVAVAETSGIFTPLDAVKEEPFEVLEIKRTIKVL